MRAKEYIACSGASLKYPAEIKQIIADMLPLRASREHTVDYYNKHLIPDIGKSKNFATFVLCMRPAAGGCSEKSEENWPSKH